eukprot:5894119-Prymnesium_polylepis.1
MLLGPLGLAVRSSGGERWTSVYAFQETPYIGYDISRISHEVEHEVILAVPAHVDAFDLLLEVLAHRDQRRP